ncbi:MAG TPA: hypothetical protein VJN69_13775 [Candidatus Acidoferrales bacterium]|nr:hypothetical protein [Candidatus Acidoferrales bacterium]
MQVTVNVPDQVAAEARARGLSTEVYVEELITTRINTDNHPEQREVVAAAIDRILERRERHKLDGLKIKDLINEGRKF